jgi:hypothetical protein
VNFVLGLALTGYKQECCELRVCAGIDGLTTKNSVSLALDGTVPNEQGAAILGKLKTGSAGMDEWRTIRKT